MERIVHVNVSKDELIKVFKALGVNVFDKYEQEVGASSQGCLNEKCEDYGNYEENYTVDEVVSNDGFVFIGLKCATCTNISISFLNATEYYKEEI